MTDHIKSSAAEILNSRFSDKLGDNLLTVSDFLLNTPPADFPGDITVVLFPIAKRLGMAPDTLGNVLGEALVEKMEQISKFDVVKGFLNLTYSDAHRLEIFEKHYVDPLIGLPELKTDAKSVMVEYPSPNTNKPLHLGHLRNIFLGASVCRIVEASGKKAIPVCLFNDRGIHICKSMVARQQFMPNETPESTSMKGDKFVGECYVRFANAYKAEVENMVANGMPKEQAEKEAPLQKQVEAMLLKWEEGDAETRELWHLMNGWCYEGMQETFDKLEIRFDKKYYESEIYNIGRETVKEGLDEGVFFTAPDGSVRIDLTDVKLDEKVVLRANGTTIYITQDIAIAYQKQKDFDFEQSIYVVGNEQDYHFKVLFEILKRLGMKAADKLFHLSYGMMELPTGKMKSREGTVVDADDLLDEMTVIARQKAEEAQKSEHLNAAEQKKLFEQVGYGALRYFILKVDPKKKMIFNPLESIDIQGNTGPFIQYAHARCCSVLRKAGEFTKGYGNYLANDREWAVVRRISNFAETVDTAGKTFNPSGIANFAYELAKEYNQFYHDHQILNEPDENAKHFRLRMTELTARTLSKALYLLGIAAPEKM